MSGELCYTPVESFSVISVDTSIQCLTASTAIAAALCMNAESFISTVTSDSKGMPLHLFSAPNN
jgi:hypothetical protein